MFELYCYILVSMLSFLQDVPNTCSTKSNKSNILICWLWYLVPHKDYGQDDFVVLHHILGWFCSNYASIVSRPDRPAINNNCKWLRKQFFYICLIFCVYFVVKFSRVFSDILSHLWWRRKTAFSTKLNGWSANTTLSSQPWAVSVFFWEL